MTRRKFKFKNEQRAKTPKKARQRYGSLTMYFNTMRAIYLQSFMLISLIDLKKCPGQCSKCKNEQKGHNSNIRQDRVMFFYQCTSTQ
jgi:hypothetical protein